VDDPPVGEIGGGSASWWDWWGIRQLVGLVDNPPVAGIGGGCQLAGLVDDPPVGGIGG